MPILRDVAEPKKLTNQMLIDGIERSDAYAASVFFERFGKRIGALVWTMMGADAEHGDVVQTVYVNVIQSIGSIRDSKKLSSWVDSVVYRVVCKELKKRKRSKLVPVESHSPTFESSGRHGGTSIATNRFIRILERMDPDVRMVFSMKYLDDLMLTQIAEISGLSLSTVKRRIKRAKQIFEDLVEEDLILQADLEGHTAAYRWCS